MKSRLSRHLVFIFFVFLVFGAWFLSLSQNLSQEIEVDDENLSEFEKVRQTISDQSLGGVDGNLATMQEELDKLDEESGGWEGEGGEGGNFGNGDGGDGDSGSGGRFDGWVDWEQEGVGDFGYEGEILGRMNIETDFFSQAPFGNWGNPYQEACEEASVLLAANYFKGMGLEVNSFDRELLKMIDWEKKRFGYYEDTDVAETAEIVEDYLGLNAVIHENPGFEDLQEILAKGHLVVAPFYGKGLKNPYYSGQGPEYHMMLLKGYDAGRNEVIVHDVGTRRGENYVYKWPVIWESLHDFEENGMEKGRKVFIEVWG